jgi:hypothetical protein
MLLSSQNRAGSSGFTAQDVFQVDTLPASGDGDYTITNGVDLLGKGGLVVMKQTNIANATYYTDTVRGAGKYLKEETNSGLTIREQRVVSNYYGYVPKEFYSNGFRCYKENNGAVVAWTFRKAEGFFDIVDYTGSGATAKTVPHNLGVAPELMIVRCYSHGQLGRVFSSATGANYYMSLIAHGNLTDGTQMAPAYDNTMWNGQLPTASNFQVKASLVNTNTYNYIAYLFASLPGVSKIGTFTGNNGIGSVDCGFTGSARFVLIKCITAGVNDGWYVFDTTRGIAIGNDPSFYLDLEMAQATVFDLISPYTGGFSVKYNSSTTWNVTGRTYLYMAIA